MQSDVCSMKGKPEDSPQLLRWYFHLRPSDIMRIHSQVINSDDSSVCLYNSHGIWSHITVTAAT